MAISDVVTGLFGTVAVLAGLLARAGETRAAASGSTCRCSRATLAVLVNQAQNAFVGGAAPGRLGNAHPNIVPYETFATADGELAVAVGSERQWPRLCEALGVPGAGRGPAVRHQRRPGRAPRRAAAHPRGAVREPPDRRLGWRRSTAADIPCGPINDVAAAFASPQAVAREMVVEVEHPVLGAGAPGRAARSGCRRRPASIRTPPPLLGEHPGEILAELGYGPRDVDTLRPSRPADGGGPHVPGGR